MAGTSITKQQMLSLLGKLSSDDGFRARFEKDPRAGLIEAGVPAAQANAFPADHLGSGTLADKGVFVAERARVSQALSDECLCMVIPAPGWHGHHHRR